MSGKPGPALQDTETASVLNARQLSQAGLRVSISPVHTSATTVPARVITATIAIIAASTSSPSSEALQCQFHEIAA
jgi:hypothetical protein